MLKYSAVPVPRVLDWSSDCSNQIGSEYILMDEAPGVSLQTVWPSLSVDQRGLCIHNISRAMSSINALHFPAYGSLFPSNAALDHTVQLDKDDEFCIGPHVGNQYWGCGVKDRRYYHHVSPNHGPCTFSSGPKPINRAD